MGTIFTTMIGTLAVMLLISAFIGSSEIPARISKTNRKWLFPLLSGLAGGLFGIYGNLSGFPLSGAVISVRDMGPMLSGFIGGPLGGLIAGLIAGLHRLTIGGITAKACVVATCCIGLICGAVSVKWRDLVSKPGFALLMAALMEAFHLCVVLVMVKPFETALEIVRQIALPFILVNAVGFMLMISIINYSSRQKELILERNRMKSELDVARVIQQSLLPTIGQRYPGRKEVDVSAYMRPAKEVGGDFYDVFSVDQDHLAFVVGDVSGKGIPAALFMAQSKIVLQNCVRDAGDLAGAVAITNNSLCARNDAEMFVTAWVGILDLNTGKLTFVSAGHNPPVLLRGGKGVFMKFQNSFVMAGMRGMKYKEQTLQLQDGDIIYVYSDGVTEADNKAHDLFGEERLLRCIDDRKDTDTSTIIEDVKSSIEAFVDGNSQFDDITMLCFKWNRQ